MANVKPFQAVRPAPAFVSQVAALPYDVYNRAEATAKVKGHPLSFLNIDRAETQFGPEVGTYDDCVYQKAKELLDTRMKDGTFIQDAKPCYYIYELTMNGRSQTGITACVAIDDYMKHIVKKHENTRAEKETDRLRHVDICSAQTGPIFLAYRVDSKIKHIVNAVKTQPALYDFVADDGVRHAVWIIDDDEAITVIEKEFEAMPALYIADGHHRAASAVDVGLKRRREHPDYDGTEAFNYFLAVLFPDDELMIMDYNRVVKHLNGMTEEAFLERISENFLVTFVGEEAVRPKVKDTFGMYLGHQWYQLTARPEICSKDVVKGLDVSVLQDYLLAPVLGIDDPRTSPDIEFIGGIRGLEELERRCHEDMCVAFSMYPTSIQELFDIADAGKLMPPKSTWFEPKLRSGIFIHKI